jgi:hypothetical protein
METYSLQVYGPMLIRLATRCRPQIHEGRVCVARLFVANVKAVNAESAIYEKLSKLPQEKNTTLDPVGTKSEKVRPLLYFPLSHLNGLILKDGFQTNQLPRLRHT